MARLLILYGPPGVGKETVALELARRAPSRVLLTHDLLNFVGSFLPAGSSEAATIVDWLRVALSRAMLTRGETVLMTFAYGGCSGDNLLLTRLRRVANQVGAGVNFIRLEAREQTLRSRLSTPSRQHRRKLTDWHVLEDLMQKGFYMRSFPDPSTLSIDTSDQDVGAIANDILRQLSERCE